MRFTLYGGAKASGGQVADSSWADWIEVLTAHDHRGSKDDAAHKDKLDAAKDGPAVVLGEIPDELGRGARNVKSVSAVGLDLEGVSDEVMETALEALAGFEWVVYTTHAHGAEAKGGGSRLRVVVPLSEPLPPEEHARAWAILAHKAGGLSPAGPVDRAARDVARLHYLPSTYDPAVAWAHHNEGARYDPRAFPDPPAELTATHEKVTITPAEAEAQAERVRAWMVRLPQGSPIKEASVALARGESFAAGGERHETLIRLTWTIAARWRELAAEVIEALFARSISAMGADRFNDDETSRAYLDATDKLNASDRVEEQRKKEDKTRRAREHQTSAAGRGSPYDDEDLSRIATVNGCEPSELTHRWIIQREGAAWLLGAKGDYRGPYTKDDAAIASHQVLARAPVRMVEVTKNGATFRPFTDYVRESGTIAEDVIVDLASSRTRFDAETGLLHEAATPLRKLHPEFDEGIDEWLKLLAGPLYSKLVDWIACVPDLTKLLCALYLDGAPGGGKTLLPTGLGRLWTEGPPGDLELVLSDFNDEIVRCPLLLADEEVPKRWGKQTVTTTLRSMISTFSRTLKRKYRGPAEVRGAIRLVLAANNEFLLDSKDVSSAADLDAIASRFLYINVGRNAAAFLEEVPRDTRELWGTEGIAKHALWLRDNHEVEAPGKRFWVEGDVSEMHRLLMTGSKWNTLVCEWLVRYLLNPTPVEQKHDGLIRREGGRLFVNDQSLVDGWEYYLKTRQEPETARIGSALRAIATNNNKVQKRWKKQKRIRYREIDIGHLVAWADRHNVGDEEAIKETMRIDTTVPDDADDEAII